MRKILLIEDDQKIQEVVSICLKMRWPEANIVSSIQGGKGIELAETEKPDIVILDICLPDTDGFEVLKEIRLFSNVPIIILTVRGEEVDKVKGLELGADDYIVKPFLPAELVARIGAVLRRSQTLPATFEPPLHLGELLIDPGGRKTIFKGKEVKLTATEFNLLYLLAKNEGRVLNHQFLLQRVWGDEYLDSPHYLKTYIQRLRDKLEENPKNPKLILSKRGAGYMFIKPG